MTKYLADVLIFFKKNLNYKEPGLILSIMYFLVFEQILMLIWFSYSSYHVKDLIFFCFIFLKKMEG